MAEEDRRRSARPTVMRRSAQPSKLTDFRGHPVLDRFADRRGETDCGNHVEGELAAEEFGLRTP